MGQTEGVLHLRIRDDGQGFDVHVARERALRGYSLGLLGMEERAYLAGGAISIASTPGQGTVVTATFPLPQPTATAEPASERNGK